METMYDEDKARFIENFEALAQQEHWQVERILYQVDEKAKREIVIVRYRGGFERKIDVTCNSTKATLFEIAKELDGFRSRGRIEDEQ